MPHGDTFDIDARSPPFDQLRGLQRLATDRGGHVAGHARHDLYVGRDKRTSASVLVKVTSKPGVVYEQNLSNEIASLSTVNRELPTSRYFPVLLDHGRLPDGRVYLTTYLFDEFPLATTIGSERIPGRMVTHLRTAVEVARALAELHGVKVFHVDLNPMNILYRSEQGRPVIRIIDFESSYDLARHSAGEFYQPPTTPGYSAPEVTHQAPDARADVFSLGAVLYTLLAGYEWTWSGDVGTCVERDQEVEPALKAILLTAVDPNREKRYSRIQDFSGELAAYLEAIWPGRS